MSAHWLSFVVALSQGRQSSARLEYCTLTTWRSARPMAPPAAERLPLPMFRGGVALLDVSQRADQHPQGRRLAAAEMRCDDADREEHEDQLGLLVDSRDANELDAASQDSQRSTLFTVCPFILGAATAVVQKHHGVAPGITVINACACWWSHISLLRGCILVQATSSVSGWHTMGAPEMHDTGQSIVAGPRSLGMCGLGGTQQHLFGVRVLCRLATNLITYMRTEMYEEPAFAAIMVQLFEGACAKEPTGVCTWPLMVTSPGLV